MVVRAVGYYGEPFRRNRGVTKGYLLLPTIFNVVADTVVRHWESVVAEGGREDDRDNISGDEAAHPIRQMIRVNNNRRWRTEGGNIWLNALEEFF